MPLAVGFGVAALLVAVPLQLAGVDGWPVTALVAVFGNGFRWLAVRYAVRRFASAFPQDGTFPVKWFEPKSNTWPSFVRSYFEFPFRLVLGVAAVVLLGFLQSIVMAFPLLASFVLTVVVFVGAIAVMAYAAPYFAKQPPAAADTHVGGCRGCRDDPGGGLGRSSLVDPLCPSILGQRGMQGKSMPGEARARDWVSLCGVAAGPFAGLVAGLAPSGATMVGVVVLLPVPFVVLFGLRAALECLVNLSGTGDPAEAATAHALASRSCLCLALLATTLLLAVPPLVGAMPDTLASAMATRVLLATTALASAWTVAEGLAMHRLAEAVAGRERKPR